MARYKTQRQRRYALVRDSGFSKPEAAELSKMTMAQLNTPYIKRMIAERSRLYSKAMAAELSEAEFHRRMKLKSHAKGHTKQRNGKRVPDIWAQLRDYEDDYKAKHPNWKSPFVKKLRDFVAFQSAFEKGRDKHKPNPFGSNPMH